MGSSKEEIEIAKNSVIYLLEILGFTINYKKYVLTLAKELEYLGVVINSVDMTFSVPIGKARSIKQFCLSLLQKERVTVREVSSLIGKLVAIAPAFTPAPLQIRYLQKDVNDHLRISNQNYEGTMVLNFP